jgi:hypothetical protein
VDVIKEEVGEVKEDFLVPTATDFTDCTDAA